MKFFSCFCCTLVSASLLLSCQSDKNEILESDTVNYTFSGFTVESGSLSEYSTRAESSYSMLVVDVMDGQYVQSVSRVQVSMSEALADVTLPLQVGSHHIYLLCSNRPWHQFNESDLLVSWDEQTSALGDAWTASVNLDVEAGAAKSQSVSLSRAVAFVRVMVEDALPADIAQFRHNLNGGSWTFNLVKQSGDVPAQLVRTSAVPSSYVGQSGVGVGIYTFVPSGATTAAGYTLTALDASGATLQTVSFSDVSLVANRYTTYQGDFFAYSSALKLSLQNDWTDALIIPF